MYVIGKIFNIACSHRLYDKDKTEEENKKIYGKCSNLPSHGHNYRIIVRIKSNELVNGMVMNFKELESVFNKQIDSLFDHTFLNDTMNLPTAENMAKNFYDRLKEVLPNIVEVEIWETEDSFAIYKE